MKVQYQEYEIKIFDDEDYSTQSTDNIRKYNFEYSEGKENIDKIRPSTRYGIIVKDTLKEEEISSAIICEFGGATRVHPNSYVIKKDKIWICVSDKVYCLKIPTLEIEWHKKLDFATNFSIHPFYEDYIIHGELEIFRINQEGKIVWSFGGKDIFVTMKGNDDFKIEGDRIIIKDWNEDIYILDENGKEID